jgi:hypothetical protein
VESDHCNVGGLEIVGGKEGLHHFGMRVSYQRLSLGDDCRPSRAVCQVRRHPVALRSSVRSDWV